jgi:hypothetical protein
MRVKIVKDTFISGKPVLAGDEIEINEQLGTALIFANKAIYAEKAEDDKGKGQKRGIKRDTAEKKAGGE